MPNNGGARLLKVSGNVLKLVRGDLTLKRHFREMLTTKPHSVQRLILPWLHTLGVNPSQTVELYWQSGIL